jgi:hypothetical protein
VTWDQMFARVSVSTTQGFEVSVGPILVVLVLFGLLVFLVQSRRMTGGPHFELVETKMTLANTEFTIRPNHDVSRIAHKAWVELSTRKAVVPFDPQYDLVVDVYDSWYTLFGVMRELMKDIPAEQIRGNKDTQELLRMLLEALNSGLRPHLTKWQARFRRWYLAELERNPDEAPQDIQRRFCDYKMLEDELMVINAEIAKYAVYLRQLSHGS